MNLLDDLDMYAFRKGWPLWACFLVPLFYPSSWPIVIYRFGSSVVKIRRAWLRIPLYAIYFPLKRLTEILTTIEISERAVIGGGFYIAHIGNIIIAHDVVIGRYGCMHQGVTIGVSGFSEDLPIIGDRVYFGAGAKIMGPIKIGNDVVIGANAVVIRDIPDNGIVGGVPAKILNYRSSKTFVHYRGKSAE